MRWGRDKRDSGNGVTSLGNHFINLEPWELTALARLCTLSNLNLYFVGINQIFGSDTKAARSHLLDSTTSRLPVGARLEALSIFATLTGVALGTNAVHGNSKSLVSLLADSSERHGTGDEAVHDILNAFYLIDGDRGAFLEVEEIANEYGLLLAIDSSGIFLEFLIAAKACCNLEGCDSFRIPGMKLAGLAECVHAKIGYRQTVIEAVGPRLGVRSENIFGKVEDVDTTDF